MDSHIWVNKFLRPCPARVPSSLTLPPHWWNLDWTSQKFWKRESLILWLSIQIEPSKNVSNTCRVNLQLHYTWKLASQLTKFLHNNRCTCNFIITISKVIQGTNDTSHEPSLIGTHYQNLSLVSLDQRFAIPRPNKIRLKAPIAQPTLSDNAFLTPQWVLPSTIYIQDSR